MRKRRKKHNSNKRKRKFNNLPKPNNKLKITLKEGFRLFHKCDVQNPNTVSHVCYREKTQDVIMSGSPFIAFAAYKECCHFYLDRECKKEVDMSNVYPRLILEGN